MRVVNGGECSEQKLQHKFPTVARLRLGGGSTRSFPLSSKTDAEAPTFTAGFLPRGGSTPQLAFPLLSWVCTWMRSYHSLGSKAELSLEDGGLREVASNFTSTVSSRKLSIE
jgi:hypothetical protein